ncbi:MAG: DUF6340 family protein [Bacteroidales bacterium]
MKTCALFVLTVLIMASCKTNELYINVLQPAPVTLPPEVKAVSIINRSIPTDETKLADMIDKVVTLESADLDRDGALQSAEGLAEALGANERFASVRLLNDIDLKSSRAGILPPPLTVRVIDSLCIATGSDALFSLERFDTDTRVSFSSPAGKIQTPLGNIPVIGLKASMETVVRTGWRIYAPSGILDEVNFAESLAFTADGLNPVAAVSALTGRRDAVKQVSRNAGHTYAIRILPYTLNATRDYYVKGTGNFKIAKRKAQTGKWDEAGSLWEEEVDNPRRKIAGRACYNMAIINEINGQLEDALSWAQKAWEDYKTRPALHYVRILEYRLNNDNLLRFQEEGV